MQLPDMIASRRVAKGLSISLVAALLGFGCQVTLPQTRPIAPPVTAYEASRFDLIEDENEARPSPLDIVGAAPSPFRPRLTEPPVLIGPEEPDGVRELQELQSPEEARLELPAESEASTATGPVLEMEEVLFSVEQHFPLILAALEQVEIAEGELLAAQGGFDLRLRSAAGAEVEGFYENERVDLMLEQPTTLWGTSLIGGYRLGRGDFADYDGKAKTLTDGEFRAGVNVPLLQGGRIDKRRLDVWKAWLTREQAGPLVLQKRLQATRKAARAYWRWVAAGQKLAVARRLLALAENRQDAIELAVSAGQFGEIALTENRRLIVEREAIRIGAERLLQEASIQLSLYYRDVEGIPRLPDAASLPGEFPVALDPANVVRDTDVQLALARRPEVRAIELERTQRELDLELARNSLLPQLDVGVFASQDIGDDVSDPDDKGPFELEALVRLDVPLQRRQAKGTSRANAAKISKLDRELQLVREFIAVEVQDAASAMRQTYLRVGQVVENLELAGQLEEAERLLLREGESDLLRVNLREQQTAAAAGSMIDVLAEHFLSLADYRAVLGLPYDEVIESELGGLP